MRSVRIEPASQGIFLVDIVCDCGLNGLRNKATSLLSFKHQIALDEIETITLTCACGKEYRLQSQKTHIHILSEDSLVAGNISHDREQLEFVTSLIMSLLDGSGTKEDVERLRKINCIPACSLGSTPACTCGHREAHSFLRLLDGKLSGKDIVEQTP